MIISFKEIKKYPFTYIENIISQKNDTTDGSNCLLFQYGPYLAIQYDVSEYNKSISYMQNGITKMLFDVTEIVKFFSFNNNSVSDTKKFLIDKLKSLPVNNEVSIYTTSVKIICEKYMEQLRSYQYDNKLMESSMLNFAPIVPYSGIIKQPGLTESFTNGILDDEKSNVNAVVSILKKSDNEIEDFIKSVFICNIFELLQYSDRFIKPDNYSKDYNIKDDSGEKKLSSDIISLLAPDNKFNLSSVYFAIVYIYYTFERNDYSGIIDTLSLLFKVYDEDVSFKTAMEVMNRFGLSSIEDSPLDIDTMENMEYENDKKLSALMNMADIDSEDLIQQNYKLDKLMSYIFNSRKYKTDSYTNSLFLNDNESIKGYSYIQNGADIMMVCEIDDKKLCIPVIDLSDNYKMKLVTLDKEENILVTTNFKTKDI